MYRLAVTVVEVMDLYDVHATLWETSDLGFTERISTTHATLSRPAEGWSEDAFQSILSALAQWSEMTIRESSL